MEFLLLIHPLFTNLYSVHSQNRPAYFHRVVSKIKEAYPPLVHFYCIPQVIVLQNVLIKKNISPLEPLFASFSKTLEN